MTPQVPNGQHNNAVVLEHEKADVHITDLPNGKKHVKVVSKAPGFFIRFDQCETAYPIELIEQIFHAKGPDWLCDEIYRDESPDYTGAALKWQLQSYVEESKFQHARILDFGCGSGASSCALARMFPDCEIVGIELEEELLNIARSRVEFYGHKNIELQLSLTPDKISEAIGQFDHIIMTGVFEHLLPDERKHLMPQLWSRLKPGGVLFLHETPNTAFPIETHTTGGLPFINYLPDSMALAYARRFSRRNLSSCSWEQLLRMGIRGGTSSEIAAILEDTNTGFALMEPSFLGVNDRVDLWYMSSEKGTHATAKKLIYKFISLLRKMTSIELVPYLELAIQRTD